MVMSNVSPAPWGRPLGAVTMEKDVASDLEMRKRRILKRTPMAAAATLASQQALVDAGAVLRVAKGRSLVCQGEQAATIALIGMGRLRLSRALEGARTLSIGYRGTGDLVGEAAVGGAPLYRETAVATEDVEALMVPVGTVRALAAADHAFGSCLLSALVDRHMDTEDRLVSLLFRNVEARLAEFLVKAASRWGIPEPRGVLIAALFTHQEMANLIGSTRETVTLTLGDLRRKGVIEIDRRRIVVLDRDALKARV
jgi:CRP/FNR family transcriptional regulator, cyclic AMP receptor protein